MNITFKTGEFQQFIATKKFGLGELGIDIAAGGEVEFDGIVFRYNGSEFTYPKLRGAFKQGWLVPADDYLSGRVTAPHQVSAGVQVRHATQGGNPMSPPTRVAIPTTTSDERVVLPSTSARAANVQARNAASRTASVDPRALQGQQVRDQRGFAIVAEEQDGVPVRQLGTQARTTTSMTGENAYTAVQQAKNTQFQPAQGNPKNEEERLAEMSPEQQAEYLSLKEARVAVAAPAEKKAGKPQRTVVNKVAGTTKGVTVAKGSEEVEDLSDDGGTAKVTSTIVDGIKMTNTNGPGTFRRPVAAAAPAPAITEVTSKIEKDGTASMRRRIAKALCADFPDNYDFSDHWKKRLARIRLDYETSPEIIKAIFAAESDDFKTVLMQEFPEVFA